MITINQDEFIEIKELVYKNFGIDLSKKKHLVEGRLGNLLASRGLHSFKEYLNCIYNDKTGEELTNLLNRITTNHTYFLRENAHFDYYRNVVLPELKHTLKNKSIGIWSAGCSSGEEPYTLAMLNDEVFPSESGWDTRILATDISERVLGIAKKGVYSKQAISCFPSHYQNKYLKPYGDEFEFVDKIKNNVIFRKFNLMDSFSFKKKFHVIFCRNVMIYFDNKTKMELVNKFYDATEKGGYLFIGHSEYLDKEAVKYKYIMPAVYKKE